MASDAPEPGDHTANEWDEYAAGWDADPGAHAYASAAFASLVDLASRAGLTLDGARVLDFGCGTGLLTERLVTAGATVWAVDTSMAMLDVLRAKTELLASDRVNVGAAVPTDVGPFRFVVCSSVCGFVDDYPATVVELASRLEPGGLFVQWDWERSAGEDHGLGRSEIEGALIGAELSDIKVDVGFDIEFEGNRMAPLVGHGRRALVTV